MATGRLLPLAVTASLVLGSAGGCAAGRPAAPAPAGVEVVLPPDGPWRARLAGFDGVRVASVVYWIRDARRRWRSSRPVDTAPFESPIDWWAGDNGGSEAVTAHVTLRSGRVVLDPGGWRWVDGRLASPAGAAEVLVNADGSAGATYRPALHGRVIRGVEFWLRSPAGAWARAGTSATPIDGTYTVAQLDGTRRPGWSDAGAALSVHVIWPNASQFVDPVPWVWSDRFQTSPTALPTLAAPPSAQPLPDLPPVPQASPEATPTPVDPYPDATAAGATAVCEDGTWSFTRALGDVCTHRGGVRWWTGNLGPPGPGQS